ncbi:MAG TPA: hypothetical protein VHL52_03565 [Acidimicrobiia bacterium]|nr:hypothetical protein [Acidimicrobiia bacterium]
MRRFAWLILAVVVMVVASPGPARADSAQPTNYRSEVADLRPPHPGVSFRIAGGDTFLTVSVRPGTEVEIPGYEGEPYVRIGSQGVVEVNRNSPSKWVNEDRFARTGIPAHASADAPPDWETVASDGSYGWHDHRIHWMSPEPPPAVDRTSRATVFSWVVPVLVDGDRVDVLGTLEWLPSVSPVPWLLILVAVAALSYLADRRGWTLLVGAAVASTVGVAQAWGSPLGIWSEYLAWAPPTLGLVLTGAGLAVKSWRERLAVAAVVVGVWAALRLPSLWLPVLPSPLPADVERAAVAMAAGAAAATIVAALRQPLIGRRMSEPGG